MALGSEGQLHGPQRPREFGRTDSVARPHSREAVSFRESSHHNDVRKSVYQSGHVDTVARRRRTRCMPHPAARLCRRAPGTRTARTSSADSSVPVGLCGRHNTTTRASAAASAIDVQIMATVLFERAPRSAEAAPCRQRSGYPSKVGEARTIRSPGLVTACSVCITTPVAPAPTTTCWVVTPTRSAISSRNRSGRNSG